MNVSMLFFFARDPLSRRKSAPHRRLPAVVRTSAGNLIKTASADPISALTRAPGAKYSSRVARQ